MTVSTSPAVGSVNQGSYAQQPMQSSEPIAPVQSVESVSKVSEATSTNKNQDTPDKGESQGGEASKEAIKKAVADINKHANGTEAVFGIHEKTNRITIKIVDKESKEVIKEVPAEKTLDLIAKAWELAGIMVDEKR